MLRGRDRRPAEDQRPESDGRRGQEDGRGQAPRRSREGRTPAGLPPGVIGWQSADCGVPPELQAEARRRHAGVLDGRRQEEARLARRRGVKFGLRRPGQVAVARGGEADVRAGRHLLGAAMPVAIWRTGPDASPDPRIATTLAQSVTQLMSPGIVVARYNRG